jgi:hypothetical protein
MLKRLVYIFALCCFVNSSFGCVPGAYCSDMSLLDMLIGQFQGDDDTDGEVMNKDVCGHHYTISRKAETARRWSNIRAWVVKVFSPVQHVYGNYQIRKPILPAYYNFLFRLSPF